jgi:hypothetical protein
MLNPYNPTAEQTAVERLAYSVDSVVDATDSGRTKIYKWIKSGRLRAKKADGRTIILADDLKAFLASLPDVPVRAA